ncbi:Endoglucanase 1; AltName: Full=Carboxymethyl-cellulase 1; Short=CMCase 1; Short=Cellulase 1; AltName: Full=Endo-1,4-beta-glucanase 1; Flags: Precursor [Serendipita indica DSM 11827]|nr:Endoglucanase 1; AltName: Full=Carboxymethyl-cellulase 1; Short=CMCase 1; Short=Cellulase 1; AltName: Full=Endo-1,4-beta-glucanase 1; Flags: Precursor [Serendipita indica DSM 11827]
MVKSLLYAGVLSSFITLAVAQTAGQWGQCGGTGYTGPTQCPSGWSCQAVSPPWYYQCLQGGGGATTTSNGGQQSSTRTSSSSQSTSTSGGGLSGLPRLKGVNIAGFDFTVRTDGSYTDAYVTPPSFQFNHFASQGVNAFRVPFAWQLMTPTLGGNIDNNFFSIYDRTVQAGLATGAYVIIDLHNYARWNGAIINQGGPTTSQYASIWSQLAQKYAGNSKIIFGIMNEPHDMPSIAPWVQAVQAAVNAIRSAGATSQIILIPGSSWSGAAQLPTEAGPSLLSVTDPAGGKNKLVFDVHKYLDSDGSGTHTTCVTDNISAFQNLVNWLKQNNRQAVLSETGAGSTSSCFTYFNNQLAFVKNNYPSMLGFTVWSAGSFNTQYELSVTPNPDGSDQPIWIQAVKPNL